MNTEKSYELQAALSQFDEFIYFPSIDWNHSWERQQTLISAFCNSHAPKHGVTICPTGLIDYAPWNINGIKAIFNPEKLNLKSKPVHTINDVPVNMEYVQPKFNRGTNSVFSALMIFSNRRLQELSRKQGQRLVFASYVNDLVQYYLKTADFTILDLAERRQANRRLSTYTLNLERQWASKCDLVVVDSIITKNDYDAQRKLTNRSDIEVIPQGFTLPNIISVINKPENIAVYLGNFHDAIDYEYLGKLIDINMGWQFKFCGTVMSDFAYQIISRPNVNYVGSIHKNEISNFLVDASYGLIPYLVNDWTAGVFPTKLFEYLGHRLPVLSTALPEVMRFADSRFVHISNSPIVLNPPYIIPEEIDAFNYLNTWSVRLSDYAKAITTATK